MFREDDYLCTLLTEGPPSARCELVRHLPSDDFGPRVLGRLRHNEQPIVIRGIAIADAAWVRASKRLQGLGGVRSAHVVPLIAYGRHEGLAYLIHEHEGGPRLDTMLRDRDGRLAPDELLPIFAQVLMALHDAHRRGVVVGGVRPQDIRAVPNDDGSVHVYVRNLGLAAVLGVPAGRAGSTDHASKYRAPEPDITRHPASDVFSLGVMFIRMLTGPLPSMIDDAQRDAVLRARLNEFRRKNESLEHELLTLIERAIDLRIARRPRSATRMLEGLLAVVPAEELGLEEVPELDSDPELDPVVVEEPLRWSAPEPSAPTPRQTPAPRPESAPRESTPRKSAPRNSAPLRSSPHVSTSRPAMASTSTTRPPLPRVAVVKARARGRTHRRNTLRSLVVGVGALSMIATTAVATTVAVGKPGSSPASLPTASLTTATATATALPPREDVVANEGTVVIETTPPGVLTIDGKTIGTTPVQVVIPSGRHVIRVEAKGHRTWRSRIELAAGQMHQVAVSLEAEPLVARASLQR
ncbi:MAG: PEGA domain-containing protein [Myxococcota bacterium]